MRKIHTLLLPMFFIFNFIKPFLAIAQDVDHKLDIMQLKEDYYIFTTYNSYKGTLFPSNGMYVVTDSGVVMCDSPWDTTQVLPLLDSIWERHHKKVVLCIATHFHDDRTGGLAILKREGVKTFTTRQTDKLCLENGESRAEFVFNSDTTFIVGDCTFETFYGGEGHSPDNIVLWFPKEKILYGGCLIKSVEASSLGNLSHANVDAWPVTIKKLIARYKSPNFIIPGHQSWKSKKALQHTLKLIRENRLKLDK